MEFEMTPIDVDKLIKNDIERKKKRHSKHQHITFKEYLELVKQNPRIAQNAFARVHQMIMHAGIEEIPEHERWLGVDRRLLFFAQKLFGIDSCVVQLTDHMEAGANRASTGKQIPLLVGPPASGKSSIVKMLKQGLEHYDLLPIFAISGCPKHEEPLHLLPRNTREEIEKDLGVRITGDLCHVCRHRLKTEFKSDDGTIRWWEFPVETFTFSIQGARGITSFEPSNEKASDITALTGRENVGVTSNPNRGYKDPHAFELSGEIPKAERGICEGRELTSSDPEVLNVFFSVAEEQELKITGSNFPHLSVDAVIIGHTNLTPYKNFAGDKKHEGLHQRFYVIPCPYPLRIQDEVRVYRKLIEQESDFVRLKKCHIAPGSLELAATFAVITRYVESDKVGPITKAKIYNNEKALTELENAESRPRDIQELLDEGQGHADIAKREGMFGASARDVLAALNNALVRESTRGKCLTPLTAIRAMRDIFQGEHRMGYTPEQIQKFLELLSAAEGESVMTEYKEFVVTVVNKAYLRAYGSLAEELFRKYIAEVDHYRDTKRKYVRGKQVEIKRDIVTNKPKEPDIKFLRSIEQHIPLTEAEAEVFRGEVLECKASMKDFSYSTYPPLARAVEKKLLADSKSSLTLVLASDKPKGTEEKKRVENLFASLGESGFCEVCAKEVVEKAQEFLRE
ncbi:MAG: hypothetical protein HYT93_02015 [Parcubacteria group bacterium]|nr:hypothetical protein [Parcubacteria group bacterium]